MATTATSTVKTTRMVNLGKRMKTTHMPRRIGNSIRLMKEEVARHTKTSPENVKIGGELNRYLMLGAIQGFYGIKVAVEKTGDSVKVDLAEKRKIPVTAVPAKADSRKEKPKQDEKEAEAPKKQETTPKAKETKKDNPQGTAAKV